MANAWIEYLKTVDTPTLSNAIELLGIRPRHEGFTSLEIRCQFPEFGRMVGYAVTAQVETMTQLEPLDRGKFADLYEALEASAKPGVIAFQEIGGRGSFAAHCGEVMATIFTRLGGVGLVSDCGVRDIPEVRAMGFQYFARGRVASHANFRIARVGVPVQIDGVVVQPGDILHGDENGLLLIPAGLEDSLPGKVEEVRVRERKLMDYVRGEDFLLPKLRQIMVE
ncbi:MAG: RraA family protein [Acidobacteria bacterium]|nr:RraA family protein [Acidobacteriota bacterium]